MPVTLVERYNPAWPAMFAQIADYLAPHLTGLGHTIEHVGSTSIDGMTAKPIIDLIVVVGPGAPAAVRERLESAGYVYRGDQGISGRDVYRAVDGQPSAALPAHHLYVCESDAYE
ncbi:MAG: GrpB family protein, partial [Anaerolineae bacterium]